MIERKDLAKDDNACGVAINSLCSCCDTVVSALTTVSIGFIGSLLGGASGGGYGGAMASGFLGMINSIISIVSNIATM